MRRRRAQKDDEIYPRDSHKTTMQELAEKGLAPWGDTSLGDRRLNRLNMSDELLPKRAWAIAKMTPRGMKFMDYHGYFISSAPQIGNLIYDKITAGDVIIALNYSKPDDSYVIVPILLDAWGNYTIDRSGYLDFRKKKRQKIKTKRCKCK